MLVRKTLGTLAAAWLLAGCSLAPAYHRPEAPVPVSWADGASIPVAGGIDAAAETTPLLDWKTFVVDETLRELVERALANNRELRQTLLNVEAARAQYRIQRADRLPSLQAEATGTRQRMPGVSGVQESHQAGIGLAAFELDLFGRVRSLSEAALHDYLATDEAAQAARLSLVAEVIDAYMVRDGAWQRHVLGTRMLEVREASLDLARQRRERGRDSALDVHEAEGLVQQARADLERIDREFRQAGNALVLLIGDPGVAMRQPVLPGPQDLLVQDIVAGTPSDLLERRPDIRAAEHRLQARNASIGAARAAFFPRISLTGLLGSSSTELSDLFGSGQRTWSFTPQITLPIFDAGANRANLDLAHVRKDIAVAAYEHAIQVAFREVSDALVARETLRREEDARRAMAEASRKSMELSGIRYRHGIDSHLRHLDAQRNDYANQMALVDIRTQRQSALVTLFRALGGSWP